MLLHENVVILPETQYGWRGGHPSSGGQAFGREEWWRNEPELSWDLWHPGRTDIEFSFMSSLTGLPRRRFQPLHNHKSPRRQQWKWCEWGDWDWNSSWCGCQWWPGADQKNSWNIIYQSDSSGFLQWGFRQTWMWRWWWPWHYNKVLADKLITLYVHNLWTFCIWLYDCFTLRYLTSKLVADSLMWQQTFRNDSPSPEEWSGHSPEEVNVRNIKTLLYIIFCNRAQVQSMNLLQDPVQAAWSMRMKEKYWKCQLCRWLLIQRFLRISREKHGVLPLR